MAKHKVQILHDKQSSPTVEGDWDQRVTTFHRGELVRFLTEPGTNEDGTSYGGETFTVSVRHGGLSIWADIPIEAYRGQHLKEPKHQNEKRLFVGYVRADGPDGPWIPFP